MKEIWIDVIDPDTCQEALRKTRLGRFFELDTESFICAGGESDKDMCTVGLSRLYQNCFSKHLCREMEVPHLCVPTMMVHLFKLE